MATAPFTSAVCSRLISTRIGPRCPRCHPTFNNPVTEFKERPLLPHPRPRRRPLHSCHSQNPHSESGPRGLGPTLLGRPLKSHLQSRHPCLDRPAVPPEAGSPPGSRGETVNAPGTTSDDDANSGWKGPRVPADTAHPWTTFSRETNDPQPRGRTDCPRHAPPRSTNLRLRTLHDSGQRGAQSPLGSPGRKTGARMMLLLVPGVSSATLPPISQVQEALLSFASGSAGGPSGRRSHLRVQGRTGESPSTSPVRR